jgi:hypothetical protein
LCNATCGPRAGCIDQASAETVSADLNVERGSLDDDAGNEIAQECGDLGGARMRKRFREVLRACENWLEPRTFDTEVSCQRADPVLV